jgi:hypothetical protein
VSLWMESNQQIEYQKPPNNNPLDCGWLLMVSFLVYAINFEGLLITYLVTNGMYRLILSKLLGDEVTRLIISW